MPLTTFDIFDTLLTRLVAPPTAVFLLVGRRVVAEGIAEVTPQSLASARREAERRARLNRGGGEVALDDIYRELAAGHGWSEVVAARIKELELEVEADVIRVTPEAARRLSVARENGSVAFLSDMYLPADFIRQLLQKHGLWSDGDKLYMSCEHGHSKACGTMYRHVSVEQGVPLSQITHVGNDLYADIRRARRAGVNVAPFLECNPNRYEGILEQAAGATNGLSGLLAAASRMARLQTPAANPRLAVIRDVAASVAGPLLAAFAMWILRTARQEKLGRLYFMARDGQLLLDITRRLADRMGIAIDLRYLHCSRRATLLPAIFDASEREVRWTLEGGDAPTVNRVLQLLSLTAAEVSDALVAAGFPESTWDAPLQASAADRLMSLITTGPVRSKVLECAETARNALTEYLRGQGCLDGTPFGFVDLGWSGSSQAALSAILFKHGISTTTGLYLGISKRQRRTGNERLLAFLRDRESSVGYVYHLPAVEALFEAFCTADHGMTVGYDPAQPQSGLDARPRIVTPDRSAWDWGIPLVRDTLASFMTQLLVDPRYADLHADVRAPVAELVEAFWSTPSAAEASVWGTFPFEDDALGQHRSELARPYGILHVLPAFVRGSPPRTGPTTWFAGAMRRTAWPIRILMTLATSPGTLLGRLLPRGVIRAPRRAARWLLDRTPMGRSGGVRFLFGATR